MTNTNNNTVTVFPLNGGANVSAKMHREKITVMPGTTYNFDHAGGTPGSAGDTDVAPSPHGSAVARPEHRWAL